MGARPKKEQVHSNPLIRLLNRWLLTLLLTLIAGYRYLLSPLIGQHCRFHPTCSAFAQEALILHGPWRGSWLTLGRLARCHPWADGGLDPVPGHTPSQPCDKTDTH